MCSLELVKSKYIVNSKMINRGWIAACMSSHTLLYNNGGLIKRVAKQLHRQPMTIQTADTIPLEGEAL